jgi:hypothetical protein
MLGARQSVTKLLHILPDFFSLSLSAAPDFSSFSQETGTGSPVIISNGYNCD